MNILKINRLKIIYIIFFTVLFFCSCKKDKDADVAIPFQSAPGGIFISNEGNFQSSNATVSFFDPSKKLFTIDAFKPANGQSLGDICQSMKMINGKLYIVVNNSGKIEICDPVSMKRIKTISGLTSPRYILPVDSNKAYVTDTYSNQLSIINLNTNTISGVIALQGWTEQMLHLNNKIYITNESLDYIYIVDPANDSVSDSIHISKGANSICSDINGKIWILCGGDYYQSYIASLYRIEPSTKQIETSLTFASTDYPSRLCTNVSKDTIYFLNNGVWRMNVTDNSLPGSSFIQSSGNNFYGLGIDPVKNEIYVSDAIDFVQRGKVFRYKADGTEIDNFLAGIIPGDFLFLP